VPRPETISLLKNYDLPLPAAIHMPMYYISYEYYANEGLTGWKAPYAAIYSPDFGAHKKRAEGHLAKKVVVRNGGL
jgi:hypothetical protein